MLTASTPNRGPAGPDYPQFLDFSRYPRWQPGWNIQPLDSTKKPLELDAGDHLSVTMNGSAHNPTVVVRLFASASATRLFSSELGKLAELLSVGRVTIRTREGRASVPFRTERDESWRHYIHPGRRFPWSLINSLLPVVEFKKIRPGPVGQVQCGPEERG